MRQARPGGSITPDVMARVQQAMVRDEAVQVLEGVQVQRVQWQEGEEGAAGRGGGRGWRVTAHGQQRHYEWAGIDHILLATGERLLHALFEGSSWPVLMAGLVADMVARVGRRRGRHRAGCPALPLDQHQPRIRGAAAREQHE